MFCYEFDSVVISDGKTQSRLTRLTHSDAVSMAKIWAAIFSVCHRQDNKKKVKK